METSFDLSCIVVSSESASCVEHMVVVDRLNVKNEAVSRYFLVLLQLDDVSDLEITPSHHLKALDSVLNGILLDRL